jgi:hypothetical protein
MLQFACESAIFAGDIVTGGSFGSLFCRWRDKLLA